MPKRPEFKIPTEDEKQALYEELLVDMKMIFSEASVEQMHSELADDAVEMIGMEQFLVQIFSEVYKRYETPLDLSDPVASCKLLSDFFEEFDDLRYQTKVD